MSARYDGKPFLRLVDAYVLDAIGHLDKPTDDALTAREPEIRAAYGVAGSWREIVVQRMNFPAGMAGAIREVWQAGSVKFRQANGREPDPVEFMHAFVDGNFPH